MRRDIGFSAKKTPRTEPTFRIARIELVVVPGYLQKIGLSCQTCTTRNVDDESHEDTASQSTQPLSKYQNPRQRTNPNIISTTIEALAIIYPRSNNRHHDFIPIQWRTFTA